MGTLKMLSRPQLRICSQPRVGGVRSALPVARKITARAMEHQRGSGPDPDGMLDVTKPTARIWSDRKEGTVGVISECNYEGDGDGPDPDGQIDINNPTTRVYPGRWPDGTVIPPELE